jgi:chromosome segregation ATPase
MRLPGSSGSRWALAWLVLLCAVLLLLAATARASAQTVPSARLTSIEASLIDSLEASATLRQALKEQRASRLDLETAFADLKLQLLLSRETLQKRIDELTQQLNDSLTLSDDLRAEIARLTKLLAESKAESEALSKAFEDYRSEMTSQVSGLERRLKWWKIGAVAGWVAAAVATLAALLR